MSKKTFYEKLGFSESQMAEAIYNKHYKEFKTLSDIAKDFDVCTKTIGQFAKKHNIKIIKSFFENLSGQKIGNWIITKNFKFKKRDSGQSTMWECICTKCNKKYWIFASSLKNKNNSGCLKCSLGFTTIEDSCFKELLTSYKSSAKKRNLKFNLTKKQFKLLTKSNCYYCCDPPSNFYKSNTARFRYVDFNGYKYNGIDRIDNNKGYIFENCVSCCSVCNMMKKDLSYDDFLQKINKIYENFGGL